MVLLPIQANVFTVGYGAVRFSPDLTATSQANLDSVVRAAVDESAVFTPVELPSVAAAERDAIDEFLAVADLVLVRVMKLSASGPGICRTLNPQEQ